MRRVGNPAGVYVVAPLIGLIGCGQVGGPGDSHEADIELQLGRRYVQDAAFRRQVLEESLVNPENGYSRRRLARYTEDDWGALPLWKPELVPEVPWTRDALIDAGRKAFFEYPVQVAAPLRLAFDDPDSNARYGVQAVIRTEVPDGPATAFSCATCHSRPGDGPSGDLQPGPTNDRLDYGAMLDDFYGVRTASGGWGPGRVDVTPDSTDNPTAISDLRPVGHQTHLHKTASVRNGLIELAIRTETLILTSLGQAARPPRQTAFALALFLRSLADALPPVPPADTPGTIGVGRTVFDAHCARCHAGPSLNGPPVALDEIGTDPAVGQSTDRTTGTYRVPSLRGVADRRPLLATGSVPDLQTLLDPARTTPGHRYGLTVPASDRQALLEFLAAL